jgi:putative glutamine amidotransferase
MAERNSRKRVLLPYRRAEKLSPYQEAARVAALEPVAELANRPLSLDGFDGLMLLGGSDVNPSRYGEKPQPETNESDDERDTAELDLIDQALARDLPLLAICRGFQILNVYHGGTLIQHLGSELHQPGFEDKAKAAHEVIIEPCTLLARIAGTDRWNVNSRHHQAAGKPGAGLCISARAEDGTIEALERPDKRFVLAVQWHPEDQLMKDREQLKIFTQFAEALT